jgi:prevent-host-death family protein
MSKGIETMAVSQFKAKCLSVLQRVKRTGRPVLVTRFGEPIAEVVPPTARTLTRSWIGSYRKRGRIVGDVVSPVEDAGWETLGS